MPSETDRTAKASSIHDAAEKSVDNVLYQEIPEQRPSLSLEEMEAKLRITTSPVLQNFLRTQIERIKRERGEIGQNSVHPVVRMPGQKVEPKLDPMKQVKLPELPKEKPQRWVAPNRPLTLEDIRTRRAVNAMADKSEAEAAKDRQIPTVEIATTVGIAEDVASATPEESSNKAKTQLNSTNNEKTNVSMPSSRSELQDRDQSAMKMKWILVIGFLVWVLWQVANGVFEWGIRLHWWGHTPGAWGAP